MTTPPDVQTPREHAAALQRVLADGYAVACAAGFERATWDRLPAKVALAITELREAEGAAHADTSHESWTRELLDCVVRVGGLLVELRGPTEWCVRPADQHPKSRWQPVEVTLWTVLAPLSDAVQAWRDGPANSARVVYCLERAVSRALAIYADATGRDPVVELAAIVERNRTRPARHGHEETAG